MVGQSLSSASRSAVDSGSSLAPASAAAPGLEPSVHLLIKLERVVVSQIYQEQSMVLARGELLLECVAVPISPLIGHQTANPFAPSPSDPAVPTHDFWLVIRVGDFEHTLVPTFFLEPLPSVLPSSSPAGRPGAIPWPSYTLEEPSVPGAQLVFAIAPPTSMAEMDDLESFEGLLRQYGSLAPGVTALTPNTSPILSRAGAENRPHGHLVLIDEDTGAVIGELEQTVEVEEDKVAAQDANRPVMLDFTSIAGSATGEVKVQTVPEDELDDWMLRNAQNISHKILSFKSWSTQAMFSSAEKFVQGTTPNAEPVKFSNTTKAGIKGVHTATVMTVGVTKKTLGVLNNTIAKVVETGYQHGVQPRVLPSLAQLREKTIPYEKSSPSYEKPPIPPYGEYSPSDEKSTLDASTSPSSSAPPGLPPRRSPTLIEKDKVNNGQALASVGITEKPMLSKSRGRPPTPPPSRGKPTTPALATSVTTTTTTAVALPLATTAMRAEPSPVTPSRKPGPPVPPRPPTGPASLAVARASHSTKSPHQSPPPTFATSASQPVSPLSTSPVPEDAKPPPYSAPVTPTSGRPEPPKKRPLLSRALLAAEVVWTSVEATASDLLTAGTAAASSAAGHKYGEEAGQATALLGGSVRNVALVYVDVTGVGRKSLLKGTAKGFVKTRLKSGETIRLQTDGEVETGQVEKLGNEIVVGVSEMPPPSRPITPREQRV